MKIATAAYDKNGILAIPPNVYQGQIDDALVLTTEGGYWHSVTKMYYSEIARDLALEAAIEEIKSLNGSVTSLESYEAIMKSEQRQGYLFRMIYVIEEPDHIPFTRFAATIDKIGRDPDFVYPYDGVAEHGPNYQTPYEQRLATIAAFTGHAEGVHPIPSAPVGQRGPVTAVDQQYPKLGYAEQEAAVPAGRNDPQYAY